MGLKNSIVDETNYEGQLTCEVKECLKTPHVYNTKTYNNSNFELKFCRTRQDLSQNKNC